MDATELLGTIGFTKYEADAYVALLRTGPLTGYELAKRSGVPLSRSYEVLERLHDKGLVLAQPGEPARYAAERPDFLLAGVRERTTVTLNQLQALLAPLAEEIADGFWVVRGRTNIVARARGMVEAAESAILLGVGSADEDAREVTAMARSRGASTLPVGADEIALLADGVALVGTLAPAGRCQAVLSRNAGLVRPLEILAAGRTGRQPVTAEPPADWLTWESRKQRRILRLDERRDSA
jgi:predicted transcriptional regulator